MTLRERIKKLPVVEKEGVHYVRLSDILKALKETLDND